MQAQAKATKAKTSIKPSSPKASAKPKGAATTKPSAKLEDSNVQAPAPAARPADNANNRSIEYYRYRKWMGVRGRQAKPEPEAAKA